MISIENEQLAKALERLKILIVPKNIAIYNDENQIIELYLSRFGLKEIPEDFFSIKLFEHLQKLYLNSNKLIKIQPNLFTSLNRLQYLNLGRNYLNKIDDSVFSSLQELEELDLSNNRIDRLDDKIFSELKSLRILNLKNNLLEDIPENCLISCQKMEQLDLSINKFRFLPKALNTFQNGNLTHLDLKGNYIPYEFAKTYITKPVIHSFITELSEFWKENNSDLTIPDLNKIVKQYLFDSLMSVYHYSVNVPVLNYSLLGITLGYMTKNFHLLTSYFEDKKSELSFIQTLLLWQLSLKTFEPIEESLKKLLNTNEVDNERQRRILERKQKLLNELEREVIEYGGIMDYKFKKDDINELELEPVHKNLFNLIKQFMDWNTQEYSKIFL